MPRKVDGIKISLLDADKEDRAARAAAAPGVRMYTGDDFNFAELIGGDATGHSDALLGIFDAIAPAASAALSALAAGDRARFDAILAPTVPLSRHIFAAPTRFYKTGVVFMAWLNGHQSHFTMVGGQQSARSIVHLAELFRLADAAALLRDPELAVRAHAHAARAARHRRTERRCAGLQTPIPPLLSINTATVRAQWPLPDIIAGLARHGIRGISPWRDQVAAAGPGRRRAPHPRRRARRDRPLPRRHVSRARPRRRAAPRIDDNRRAVDEALTLGAQCLVLVVGGLPKDRDGKIVSRDLTGAREMVRDGIGAAARIRARRRHARSPSSRCIRCMRPIAPA